MAEDKGLTRSQREEKVLQFWKEKNIFEKSLEKKSPEGDFVFYEGPPTANGRPAIHHLEARSFKDAIPRYRTMRGFKVPRKAGWDTHGLPVELEVEKTLGLKSKKEIESYGIAEFNKKCKESVGVYIDEWRKFTDRIGYWVNLDDAYYTYNNSYIESVWKILSHVEKRNLLYKDYKVLPWCPRCGTALSSHELAQGYKDVKDLSLYVKFKLVDFPGAYFLAWTTTPWTLPGNLALAVGPDIVYVEAKVGKEVLVLAKDRLSIIEEPYEILAEHKGKEMEGMKYEPLYNFVTPNDKTYKVYTADFVTTEDGTGVVHTAVMYGQEDFELGTRVGLPKEHLVSPDGTFIKGTDWLEGRSVVDENLSVDILKDLQSHGLLFKKENHLHSYPFCWRCKTRLIYYARDSWYIAMSKLRHELVKENEKIHWEPEYIKEGRFGEWLKEVKDWAISRERYWGTPLPVWETEDKKERIVVDSLKTLEKFAKTSGNTYLVMRHGEAISNVQGFVDSGRNNANHLTEKGRKEVEEKAEKLYAENIDLIVTSPLLRTKETAEILRQKLGLSTSAVIFDDRLKEIQTGNFDGGSLEEWRHFFSSYADRFAHAPEGGETYTDMRRRISECLTDLEKTHQHKKILIVTHLGAAYLLSSIVNHLSLSETAKRGDDEGFLTTAQVYPFTYLSLPHNEHFELDLHRPYIDDIVLEKDGKEYRRVKEVMDVWFDSGSMPFASGVGLYPADFISEGIDQTRGWFYTLHAIGILMEKGRAFKNAICLGLLLDKDGKKMSKSVGNIVDPWKEMETFGADVLRYWMYSVNQPGENKNYDERTVKEVEKRLFNLLDNVYAFYELFRDKDLENTVNFSPKNVLDQWIMVRLSTLADEMTRHLDDYKLLEPTRDLRDFVDDLSTWFVRRSRDRIKDGDGEAKQTLYYVLKTVSKLLAPFAPFAAEELYQKLRTSNDVESVHLEMWPKIEKLSVDNEFMLVSMEEVRRLVTLTLEARSKANIKIRQPLGRLMARTELAKEFLDIVADEVNVKEIVIDNSLNTDIVLDTTLTPTLIEEGAVREMIRSIQELRKEKGLHPKDMLEYEPKAEKKALFEKYKDEIARVTNIR